MIYRNSIDLNKNIKKENEMENETVNTVELEDKLDELYGQMNALDEKITRAVNKHNYAEAIKLQQEVYPLMGSIFRTEWKFQDIKKGLIDGGN